MKRFLICICTLFVFGIAHAAQCPENYYINGDECVACPDTYPNSDGNASCYAVKTRECDIPTGCATAQYETCECTEICNQFWPWGECVDGHTSLSGCPECEPISVTALPGYYVDGNTCKLCPDGTISSGGDITECTPCPAGTYPNKMFPWEPANECATCPDEYPNSDIGTADKSKCYSNPKTRDCTTLAPAGCDSAMYDESLPVQICEYIEYQNNTIKSGCGLDDNGTCDVEPISVTASPGYYVDGNTCKQCPSGTISSGGDITECTSCPAGTFANDATECKQCPDEYPNASNNGTSCYAIKPHVCASPFGCNAQYEPCEVVEQCNGIREVAYGIFPWEVYTECADITSISSCSNCDAPISLTAWPGYRINGDACEQCAAGTYSPGGNVTECVSCPENIHVSPAGATDITDCGRILKYQKPGDATPTEIFLNGIRNTSPSFNVQIGSDILYANMTPVADTTTPGMYVNYNDRTYIVTSSTRTRVSDGATFIITTTDDTTEFAFQLAATGEFTVDWGDGTIENILSTNTTQTEYLHIYSAAASYNIGFSGVATGYSTSNSAMSFGAYGIFPWETYVYYIREIYGSLGRIFPTLGDGGAGNQPLFTSTFRDATNLKGKIPAELFDGIGGTPAPRMFVNTFSYCSGLTGLSARVAGVPLYEWAATIENACPTDGCRTYYGATGLSDYDEIPDEFK